MVKHIVIKGEFQAGVRLLHEKGGQLMPVRTEDHPAIHVCGQRVTTIWPPQSRLRGQVMEMAKIVGFDPDVATTGRIVRHIVEDILKIPYKNIEPDPKFAALARKGNHWHYLHANPGLYSYAVELDVKSAYWSSLMTGKSSLLSPGRLWEDDGGLLEELDSIIGLFPKSVRLAALGGWASWRNSFWVPDRNSSEDWKIIMKSRENIKYGGLFNSSHRAILRTWKFMEAIHKLLGDRVLRIHTDGVVIDCSDGMDWEDSVEELFRLWRYDYSVKGFGHCWIHDVNSGVLGTKIVGGKRFIIEEAKKAGIKLYPRRQPPIDHRWFLTSPATESTEVSVNPVTVETQTSLPLFV